MSPTAKGRDGAGTETGRSRDGARREQRRTATHARLEVPRQGVRSSTSSRLTFGFCLVLSRPLARKACSSVHAELSRDLARTAGRRRSPGVLLGGLLRVLLGVAEGGLGWGIKLRTDVVRRATRSCREGRAASRTPPQKCMAMGTTGSTPSTTTRCTERCAERCAQRCITRCITRCLTGCTTARSRQHSEQVVHRKDAQFCQLGVIGTVNVGKGAQPRNQRAICCGRKSQ